MLAIKLIFFITFFGNSITTFTSSEMFGYTDPYDRNYAAQDFYEWNRQYTNKQNLKTENFLYRCNRIRPLPNYTLSLNEYLYSVANQGKADFLYVKNNIAIDLKLASFSITYPFHSFP